MVSNNIMWWAGLALIFASIMSDLVFRANKIIQVLLYLCGVACIEVGMLFEPGLDGFNLYLPMALLAFFALLFVWAVVDWRPRIRAYTTEGEGDDDGLCEEQQGQDNGLVPEGPEGHEGDR